MRESNSKSSNKVKSKSKTNYSNLFNDFSNSPGKIKKSKRKIKEENPKNKKKAKN